MHLSWRYKKDSYAYGSVSIHFWQCYGFLLTNTTTWGNIILFFPLQTYTFSWVATPWQLLKILIKVELWEAIHSAKSDKKQKFHPKTESNLNLKSNHS